MSDETLAVNYRLPNECPADYRKFYSDNAKKKFARGLFDYLWEHKETRMCVSIKEITEEHYDCTDYTITCRLDAVQEYPVTIRMAKFEDMEWKALSSSAIGEIKRRVRNWFTGRK